MMDVYFYCKLIPLVVVVVQGCLGLARIARLLALILTNYDRVLGVSRKLARRVHISCLIYYVD